MAGLHPSLGTDPRRQENSPARAEILRAAPSHAGAARRPAGGSAIRGHRRGDPGESGWSVSVGPPDGGRGTDTPEGNDEYETGATGPSVARVHGAGRGVLHDDRRSDDRER